MNWKIFGNKLWKGAIAAAAAAAIAYLIAALKGLETADGVPQWLLLLTPLILHGLSQLNNLIKHWPWRWDPWADQ